MYAHMLYAAPGVLLYPGFRVWVERKVSLYPPGKLRVGFVFVSQGPLLEGRGGS